MHYTRIASSPVTHIGWGAIEKLPFEIEQYMPARILIVADPVLQSLGFIDNIIAPLQNDKWQIDIYTDLIPEPTLETGEKIVAFTRREDYSLVVGIGGGSVLDMSKLAAVLAGNPGGVNEYLNLTATRTIRKRGIPKLLIPTTSGTGAEVTNIAVLALEKTKDVIAHDYLIADTAIVDPSLTITVPPAVTAATGADALTHAIEAYLSVNANAYSDGLSLQAIKLIGGALERAVKNAHDERARTDMSYGSYLAGLAFFNAGVGAVHALAYPLGGQFHIAHGASNAVLLPYVLQYISNSCSAKMRVILETLGGEARGLSDEEAARECVIALGHLVKNIGIPEKLGGFGIPETAAIDLATDGFLQKRLLARCPMTLNESDILKIYQSAFAGILS